MRDRVTGVPSSLVASGELYVATALGGLPRGRVGRARTRGARRGWRSGWVPGAAPAEPPSAPRAGADGYVQATTCQSWSRSRRRPHPLRWRRGTYRVDERRTVHHRRESSSRTCARLAVVVARTANRRMDLAVESGPVTRSPEPDDTPVYVTGCPASALRHRAAWATRSPSCTSARSRRRWAQTTTAAVLSLDSGPPIGARASTRCVPRRQRSGWGRRRDRDQD